MESKSDEIPRMANPELSFACLLGWLKKLRPWKGYLWKMSFRYASYPPGSVSSKAKYSWGRAAGYYWKCVQAQGILCWERWDHFGKEVEHINGWKEADLIYSLPKGRMEKETIAGWGGYGSTGNSLDDCRWQGGLEREASEQREGSSSPVHGSCSSCKCWHRQHSGVHPRIFQGYSFSKGTLALVCIALFGML